VARDVDAEPDLPLTERLRLFAGDKLGGYFWLVLKNVVGWAAILASPILGVVLPGPGGIPLFVIGFALVTFPGKRQLTTRVFRGKRLPIESPLFTGLITLVSVLVTGGLMWAVGHYYQWIVERVPLADYGLDDVAWLVGFAALAAPVTMGVLWVGLKLLNYVLIRWVPPTRRFLRRTLRKWGVELLPTRRRRIGGSTKFVNDEIIGLDDKQRRRLKRAGRDLLPWVKRLIVVSLMVATLYFVVNPVATEWAAVRERLGELDLLPILLGTVLYAIGLLLFRAATWRTILAGLGHPLPPIAAVRIWATGHLARNVPGRSYAVLRMELARPYGPSGPQANAAGQTEGTLATMSGLLLGLLVLWLTAWTYLPDWRALWLLVLAFSPALVALVSPRIFYKLVPTAGRGGRTRLSAKRLLPLAGWEAIGFLWQGVAVWLLISGPLAAGGSLHVVAAVAGAYAVAFVAGALATIVPAGLGVRELVLVATLTLFLPRDVQQAAFEAFQASATMSEDTMTAAVGRGEAPSSSDILNAARLLDPTAWWDAWWAFLLFLAILLRFATTIAEMLLATAATAADWRALLRLVRGDFLR
jgi:hypothetical protein